MQCIYKNTNTNNVKCLKNNENEAVLCVFNILQLFVINKKWFRRYYSNTVKVLSFIGYNLLVVAVSVFFYSAYILMMMMQTMQNAPK